MEAILVQPVGLAVDDEERCAGGHELPEPGDELEHDIGPGGFLDELLVSDHRQDTRLRGADDRRGAGLGDRRSHLVRVAAVDELPAVLADELDERGDPQRLADVLHVDDEHRDADEHEDERRDDRDAGHLTGAVTVVRDLPDGEDRVDERRDEEADRKLARLVAQDALDDPRRELPHRELHDDHRDRQHERREAHHRRRDGRQDRRRRIRVRRRGSRGSRRIRRDGRGLACRRRSRHPRARRAQARTRGSP